MTSFFSSPSTNSVINFYNFYGERGKDYIEVHHLIPLSTLEEEFEIRACW